MRDRRRSAFGAKVIACALGMLASFAHGGAVCDLDDDDDVPLASADAVRPSEWIAQIIGDDPSEAAPAAASEQATESVNIPAQPHPAELNAGPGAAVIPLPAPVWPGAIGLGALVAASARRKLCRIF
jgi:hypothetical protein